MANKKYLIVIGGPTASGKTSLAIALAQYFSVPILSADSRQFFREMTIGTAKPDATELAAATHHFIDNLSIEDSYSTGDYERDAIACLANIYQQQDIAIMVGGSGMYIKAVCEGLDQFPDVPESVRTELNILFKEKGIEALQAELAIADPAYHQIVDLNNPHRLIRALAVCRVSQQPFSSFWQQPKAKRSFTPIYIAIETERELLYQRINQRVDLMLEKGLFEEAKKLYTQRSLVSINTVGYSEFFEHLDGESTYEAAVELIKRNSRRYAKRQMTWLRKNGLWEFFPRQPLDPIINYIENNI